MTESQIEAYGHALARWARRSRATPEQVDAWLVAGCLTAFGDEIHAAMIVADAHQRRWR